MSQRSSRQNTAKKRGCPKGSTRIRREGMRLGAALLIFVLCYSAAKWIPAVKHQVMPFLQNILSCSCDFEEAVRCFSTGLEQGDDVGGALEEFCVTAFAVQPTSAGTAMEGEYAVLADTAAWFQTQ